MTVHAVGVGASLRDNPSYRDIQVTGIDCPDRMMLNNVARVTGSIDAVGLGGRVIQPVLDEDGRQVAQAELTLDDVGRLAAGRRSSFARRRRDATPTPFASSRSRARRSSRTTSGRPWRWSPRRAFACCTSKARCGREYGALVDRFLAKDPDLEFCALVQTRPNVFLRRTNMERSCGLRRFPNDQETIDKFDVFIFGDIDSSYIRPEQQQMFVKRIRAGAGLVMLGGYHSLGPGGYAGTPLGDALPLKLGGRELGQFTEPFLPVLTPDGVRHPIFANIAGFFPTRQGGGENARASAAGRLHARRGGPARRHRAGHAAVGGGRDAGAGRAAAGSRPHRGVRRRHHAKMAAGAAGARPGFALPAFLGADGSLAGRSGRYGRSPGRHRRQRRQGRLMFRQNL